MLRAWCFIFSMLLVGLSSAARASEIRASASSSAPSHAPAAAVDHDDWTAWCASDEAPGGDEWWQAEFPSGPRRLGAIHMRSGLFKDGILQGHKARRFVWAYQRTGSADWTPIPETEFQGDRYQLIFRFPVVKDVVRVRLQLAARDPDELKLTGHDSVCLREVSFFSETDASIPVTPWGLAVTTWEEGNAFDPLKAPEGRFDVETVVRQALVEATGHLEVDAADAIWVGEFHPAGPAQVLKQNGQAFVETGGRLIPHEKFPRAKGYAGWIVHEPAPSFLLLSGSFWNYTAESPAVLSGFYNYLRTDGISIPLLGACGGHQLTAMVLANPGYAAFADEFASNDPHHTVYECSRQYLCGLFEGPRCCREEGARSISPNVPGIAMGNRYATSRYDMLFNLVPLSSDGGFKGYLHHWDSVNPERIAPRFDIIATYPRTVAKLGHRSPTLVQAMKLKSGPIYGTQFHWDESTPWDCNRDDGHRNMERILKNFVFMGLNRLDARSRYRIEASSSSAGHPVGNLTDLDRASMWCSSAQEGGDSTVTISFDAPVTLGHALMVEGDTPASASRQSYRFETSVDGRSWTELVVHRVSAWAAQKKGDLACESAGGTLPGIDDQQTMITTFEAPVAARFMRLSVSGPAGTPRCVRELFLY